MGILKLALLYILIFLGVVYYYLISSIVYLCLVILYIIAWFIDYAKRLMGVKKC
jgi:hypothetical protein